MLTIRGANSESNKGDVVIKILETKNHQKIIKQVRRNDLLTRFAVNLSEEVSLTGE